MYFLNFFVWTQHPHVYSPVIQGNARMMAPPTHAQPGLVSSSATQYGAHEQTHAMYGRKHFLFFSVCVLMCFKFV